MLLLNATMEAFLAQNVSSFPEEGFCSSEACAEGIEYFVLAFLWTCLLIGGPINLFLLYKLLRSHRSSNSRVFFLKLQVNISDLLVLFVYTGSKIVWHSTFAWYGGDFLCKTIKFFHSFPFYLSSMSLVSLGMDRMLGVLQPFSTSRNIGARTVALIGTSYCYSAVLSIPQVVFWKVGLVPNTGYYQCSTVWRFESLIRPLTNKERMINEASNIIHLVTVFWLPLVLMLISYGVMAWYLFKHERQLKQMGLWMKQSTPACHHSTISQHVPTRADSTVREPISNFDSYMLTRRRSHTLPPNLGCRPPLPLRLYSPRFRKKKLSRFSMEIKNESIPNNSEWDDSVGSFHTDETIRRWRNSRILSPSFSVEESAPRRKNESPQEDTSLLRLQKCTSASNHTLATLNDRCSRCSQGSSKRGKRLTSLSLIKTSLGLMTVYFICWLPYHIKSIWPILTGNKETMDNYHLLRLMDLAIVLNSVVNPFIYGKLTFGT